MQRHFSSEHGKTPFLGSRWGMSNRPIPQMGDGGWLTAQLRACTKPKWPRGIMNISAELTPSTLAGLHVPTALSGVYAHSLPNQSIGDWESCCWTTPQPLDSGLPVSPSHSDG